MVDALSCSVATCCISMIYLYLFIKSIIMKVEVLMHIKFLYVQVSLQGMSTEVLVKNSKQQSSLKKFQEAVINTIFQ